jgi:hypothetical protein
LLQRNINLSMMTISLAIIIISAASAANYSSMQIIIINWGDGFNNLKITPEVREINSEDSSDIDIVPGSGPDEGFVDRHENFYFYSYGELQVKGFTNGGRVFLNYSRGETQFDPRIWQSAPAKLFVDSVGQIYILDALMRKNNLSIADTSNHLISILSPYGEASNVRVDNIYFNSNDVLTLVMRDGAYYTFTGGSYAPGGCSAWKAKDGFYYVAFNTDSLTIFVEKLDCATTTGNAKVLSQNTIDSKGSSLRYTEFLGVDDQMRLYLYIIESNPEAWKVLIFDKNLIKIDQLDLPVTINKYERNINPFMRPSNGNIYEFRCQDDGLHVIRWTKQ